MPELSFSDLLISGIKQLRQGLRVWMDREALGLTRESTEMLTKGDASRISQPHINLPDSLTGKFKDKLTLAGQLWQIYNMDFFKMRGGAIEELEKTLTPEAIDHAHRSAENTFVTWSGYPDSQAPTWQFSLRKDRIKQSLLVVPLNDREAYTIRDIALQIGMKVKALEVRHGTKLDEPLVREIVNHARKEGLSEIIVVELPGPQDLENSLNIAMVPASGLVKRVQTIMRFGAEVNKLKLVRIDHHSYGPGEMNRSHRLSSLEQFARHIGYTLNEDQLLTAVNDRSFAYGIDGLGVSKENMTEFMNSKMDSRPDKSYEYYIELLKQEPISTATVGERQVEVRLISRFNGKIGLLGAVGFLVDYPKLSSVLIYDGDVRFSGDPALVQWIEPQMKQFAESQKIQADIYSGGDPGRSMFFGIKFKDGDFATVHAGRMRLVNEFARLLRFDKTFNQYIETLNAPIETYLKEKEKPSNTSSAERCRQAVSE
jgi:hypothetical protein